MWPVISHRSLSSREVAFAHQYRRAQVRASQEQQRVHVVRLLQVPFQSLVRTKGHVTSALAALSTAYTCIPYGGVMPKVPPGRYARPMWFATGTVRYIAGTAAPHFWVGTVPPRPTQ